MGLIAPPWVPVPPPAYGGTELVVDLLATGLQAAGCEVVLFATGDSTSPVPRRWHYDRALGTVADEAMELPHVAAAYDELDGLDVIHDHTVSGPGWACRRGTSSPVVATMHGRMDGAHRSLYRRAAEAGVAVVAISEAQRRSAPEVPVAAVIHHGLDLARFPVGDGDGGYVLFLGRMSPDKGAHRAIAAARAAGKRLVLAAKIWEPDEQRYFDEVIAPVLGPDATFVGEVAGDAKLALLAGAEALVNPIRWPEPFGLVMIEALACGTPVVAFPEGAAPEIIRPGRTGFLCADEHEMATALGRCQELDRQACRADAEARFSAETMVQAHLALYESVGDGPSKLAAVEHG